MVKGWIGKRFEWYELVAEVSRKSGNFCFYCGVKCAATHPRSPDYFTVDHIVPMTRGGSHEFHNLLPACRLCNSAKRDIPFEEFFVDHRWMAPQIDWEALPAAFDLKMVVRSLRPLNASPRAS